MGSEMCIRDRCASGPCQNRAACVEGTPGTYSCICRAGYANGLCRYDFLESYQAQCTVTDGGNCDVDVDECASAPCQNGATCTESAHDAQIALDAYSCACAAGFANGICQYSFQPRYASQCRVALGGNCDVDVDECASAPCQYEGVCKESSDGIADVLTWQVAVVVSSGSSATLASVHQRGAPGRSHLGMATRWKLATPASRFTPLG